MANWERIFERLPSACPTCTSIEPTTYYGPCFDNIHSAIFDPRLPLDPWHAYMADLRRLLRDVDNLTVYVDTGRQVRERVEAERDRLADENRALRAAIGDIDQLRHIQRSLVVAPAKWAQAAHDRLRVIANDRWLTTLATVAATSSTASGCQDG